MQVVFDFAVPINQVLSTFADALKKAPCKYKWAPNVINHPLGDDTEKGVVAYLEIPGKQKHGLRIVLQPLLERKRFVTKTNYAFIEFGKGVSANPRWGTISHPKKSIMLRKYARDFDAIIEKFQELLAEITQTDLKPVLAQPSRQ